MFSPAKELFVQRIYENGSTITGRLRHNSVVSFKKTLKTGDKLKLFLFLCTLCVTSLGLVVYLSRMVIISNFNIALALAVTFALAVEMIRVLQTLTLAVFARYAQDPIPMTPGKNLRIAVLTTIVPGKEPFELVAKTLKAMKRIDPGKGNTLDVWLLDEGNDPYIKAECKAMGVMHFSRKGIPKWNTEAGSFRARTKAGNHNSWRDAHENKYDIVAQMDPDHIPRTNFIIRTIGYFKDPDVGFVVAPQVYGNLKENWIARASAIQAYVFHGIVQRGGNGMGAPLLIGTNHLYRVTAFKQINGYQDSIIEDHLTSLVISGTKNANGNAWKGIYTPDILAVGEGPTSFTDYFNQQKRWAYGIWDIVRKNTPSAIKKLTWRQKLTFVMLQFFYPSLAFSWVLSSFATLLFGIAMSQNQGLSPVFTLIWIYSFMSSLGLFIWLRKFNLAEHERKDLGLLGIALTIMCLPVYASAAWQAFRRKPLTYAVTAKGNLASPDTIKTFAPHFYWILFNLAGLAAVLALNDDSFNSSAAWGAEHIAICLAPVTIFSISKIKSLSLNSISIPSLAMPKMSMRLNLFQREKPLIEEA
jgi:cellulose synthase (UDP-forming)